MSSRTVTGGVGYNSMEPVDDETRELTGEEPGSDVGSDEESGEVKGKNVELDEDVYGAAIFSMIHDGTDLLGKVDHDDMSSGINALRLAFIMFSLMVNYFLQFGLLYFSYYHVASPAVVRVQNVYKAYHAECFDADGTFSQEKWDAWPSDKRDALCNVVYSRFLFLYSVLCLWWMTVMNECRKTERMLRNFMSIPSTTDADTMIETDEDGAQQVKRLVAPVRWGLYILLVLPKFMISVVLLILGTTWLTATDDFADLILNAVALTFIIEIDETIFEALFPANVRNRIAEVTLFVREFANTPEKKAKEVLNGYLRSIGYYLIIIIMVALFMIYGQVLPVIGVIPGYAGDAACPQYWDELATRPCGFLDPMKGVDCFPYGTA